ncbi:MAG TPA: hypothetical protein VFA41_06300 [Ktedonobacteraceae bacterium]|jgi:hypothetical protein|nr:hypothetical protein [Ktedonobacteraceae bacterium]
MSTQEVSSDGKLAASNELRAERQHEMRERTIFGLALALATEPSKLGQLRQMLMDLSKLQVLPEEFMTWACERVDERLLAMALEYAHDAEVLLQILSFKGGRCAGLLRDIEDLYQQEKISQRVYVTAKLLLRDFAPPKTE